MVNLIMAIQDRETRNQAARAIIDVMGNLYPYLRDVPDFKHKLWDHLAIMADFKLDIDYPYDPPSPEILYEKPKNVPYTQHNIKIRHYGRTMELMIEKAIEFEEGREKDILVSQLANHMKKSYLTWNKDSVEDEKIFNDLRDLSKGKLTPPAFELAETKAILAKQPQPQQQVRSKNQGQRRGNYKKH
ncbi:MAG TPA: DUF4290 domain-containing protein, partial [Prolixibacteraceae bacterium]|nr:DUF4290 domain-containing protein [Prolixibacteraceae bacterium]